MKRQKLWKLSGLYCLALVLLLACTRATAPTPAPTAKPTPKPTTSPAAVATSTPAPTSKPTPATAPVSFGGKTITIVTLSAPGGGVDATSRVYAKLLARYLPGNPTMIVRNMPGGSGTIAVNYVYASKPDGMTALGGTGGAAPLQLLGSKSVRYDFLKMTIVVAYPSANFYYANPAVVDKRENILKAKGIIYGTSGGASAWLTPPVKGLIDFPTERMALAYSGTGDSRRAFLAGEINVSTDTITGYLSTIDELVKKGEAVVLFQTGLLDAKGDLVKDPGYPSDIPTMKELYEKLYGKSPSGIEWKTYKSVLAVVTSFNDALYLPPGTPQNIVRAYWDAAEKMLQDPEFKEAGRRLAGRDAPWVAGEACDKGFRVNFVIDPEIRDWMRTTSPKYGLVID
ncbi:MAG: hypothetical protein HYX90_10365 [Chloroflexi bacterium]|nr:hypothetical protein [Chloroflexota bacterium]